MQAAYLATGAVGRRCDSGLEVDPRLDPRGSLNPERSEHSKEDPEASSVLDGTALRPAPQELEQESGTSSGYHGGNLKQGHVMRNEEAWRSRTRRSLADAGLTGMGSRSSSHSSSHQSRNEHAARSKRHCNVKRKAKLLL